MDGVVEVGVEWEASRGSRATEYKERECSATKEYSYCSGESNRKAKKLTKAR